MSRRDESILILAILVATIFAGYAIGKANYKPTYYQKVYIEWTDIITTDSGWRSVDELDEWIESESSTVHQIGMIYKKTDQYIILIDSHFDNETIGTAIKIPMCNVIKIQYLK